MVVFLSPRCSCVWALCSCENAGGLCLFISCCLCVRRHPSQLRLCPHLGRSDELVSRKLHACNLMIIASVHASKIGDHARVCECVSMPNLALILTCLLDMRLIHFTRDISNLRVADTTTWIPLASDYVAILLDVPSHVSLIMSHPCVVCVCVC